MIIYRKNSKEVVMITEGNVTTSNPNLIAVDIQLTPAQKLKQKSGWKMFYRNGIQFEKPPHVVKKDLQSKVKKAKSVQELKAIILDLI